MAYSYQRATSDGTMTFLDVSIDYLDRSEISVYFDDVLTMAWSWSGVNEKRILFSPPPVQEGVVVMVKRITDASKLRHAFSLGAKFTAETLDEDLEQALHMAQEASEANLVGDFFTDINLHGFRLYNVGPAVDDTDALTLGQYKEDADSAWAAAAQAESAAADAQAAASAVPALAARVTTVERSTWTTSVSAIRALDKTKVNTVNALGYYAQADGGGGQYVYDSADTTSADNAGTVIVGADGGRWKLVHNRELNLRQFGARGDNSADDTAAILAAKAYAVANLPFTLNVSPGTYRYTDIGNWAYSGLVLRGSNHRSCVFKRVSGTGVVFEVDAFKPGLTGNDSTAPFVMGMNVSNITFEGVSTSLKGLDLQGLARCRWTNVVVRNVSNTTGIAVHMRGVMLSVFDSLICSTDMDTMTSIPSEGLRLEAGTRNSINVGNCSNLLFTAPYFEGLPINGRFTQADQVVITGGSFESGGTYDLLVGAASRYNTFVGVGFESTSVTANVSDGGVHSRYVNCYANKSVVLQGRNPTIEGGFYHKIDIQAGTSHARVLDATIRNWESSFPGAGGLFDAGTDTLVQDVYDIAAAAYVYPKKDRAGITVGASPFTWTNTTGSVAEVIVQAGTVSQIRHLTTRNGSPDNWLKPAVSPTSHLIPPGDSLEVSYSVAPTMSYLRHPSIR